MVKMVHSIERSWFYENLHLGTPGDRDFYRRVVSDAGSVLELGGGTGRLARVLAAHVPRYSVLELDPNLAALLKRELLHIEAVHEADMRSFSLEARFDRIILPYNALYCAGGVEGVAQLFATVKAHLATEGEFWFDAYGVDAYHEALLSGEASSEPEPPEVVLRAPFDGKLVEVTEETKVAPEAQRLTVTYRAYVEGEQVGEEVLHHDYLTRAQIEELLRKTGLTISAYFGDFEGGVVDEDSGHHVVCATAPT